MVILNVILQDKNKFRKINILKEKIIIFKYNLIFIWKIVDLEIFKINNLSNFINLLPVSIPKLLKN